MSRRINNLLLSVAAAVDFVVSNEVAGVADLRVEGKTPLIQIQIGLNSVPPTCSEEERRQLEPSLAFWSELAGAFAAQVHSLCASVTAVYLPFFVFGRVLTRLD